MAVQELKFLFLLFSVMFVSPLSKLSLFFLIIHQTEKVRAEPSKNNVFGMPGIKPKRNKTHALGNHACLTPI